MSELFEVEVLKEYDNDTYIKGFGSLELFFQDYPKAREMKCFYENFYKDYVIMIAYLPFNRKVTFEYHLEHRDGISFSRNIADLKYYKPDIKVLRMQEGYQKVKNANYLNELKLLKEKYGIKN